MDSIVMVVSKTQAEKAYRRVTTLANIEHRKDKDGFIITENNNASFYHNKYFNIVFSTDLGVAK